MSTVRRLLLTLSVVLMLAGCGLMIAIDWKIALGVFLFTWGNRMEARWK